VAGNQTEVSVFEAGAEAKGQTHLSPVHQHEVKIDSQYRPHMRCSQQSP
jgi:hypothetical protein